MVEFLELDLILIMTCKRDAVRCPFLYFGGLKRGFVFSGLCIMLTLLMGSNKRNIG